MKALEIFTGMIIFNAMCYAINMSKIYFLGYGTGFTVLNVLETFIAAIVGAVATQAVIGFFSNREPSSSSFVYIAIGSTYWGTFIGTVGMIGSIISPISGYNPVITFLTLTLFTVLAGYAFIAGIGQMITGGWKGYK